MKRRNLFLLLIVLIISAVSIYAVKKNKITASKIFINGVILTVDSSNTIAQAVAIGGNTILSVGTTAEMLKLKGTSTVVVDLQGKTMIPGIIDGHSHIMNALNNDQVVNIEAPPVGTVKSIPDIIAKMKKFKEEHNVKDEEWIMARGYDPDQLEEKRHPVKEDLDAAFPNNPVF